MADQDAEDRTEQPTAKRLREAREKGEAPRSRELANVAVLGASALALMVTAPQIGAAAQRWMRDALSFDAGLIGRPQQLTARAGELLVGLMLPLLPLVLVALAACVVGPLLMGGLRFSGQALQPDFKRMSPMAGLKRMYGKESVAELVRSLLRVGLIAGVGGAVVYGAFAKLLAMPSMSLEAATAAGLHMTLVALLAMAGSLGVLAAIDVPWQHWQFRNRLKMTKQEVRDELKESEGNPEVKARVRRVAQQISQRRMMDAVPTADVVVTNPTHFAVALKYEAGNMRAPKVVAKGVDEMALAIRDVAGKHRVTVVESPPLARALYRSAQVDQEIPLKLYAAVAQVLSYVYQLKRWTPGRGAMPSLAAIEVGADGAVDAPAAAGSDGEPTR